MDVIVADKLSVEFPVYGSKGRSLRHRLLIKHLTHLPVRLNGSRAVGGMLSEGTSGVPIVKALDGIDLRVKEGDRLGLIGHNGCGKTTLLRALAGIYQPTGGRLFTSGRIMPLFNMTEGMDPDATGRELIKVRCVLLGIEEDEMNAVIPEVIDFCELDDFLDMPVRTYSTGMLIRLLFAITTSVSADILLFDELIGAGDASFVERAQKRMATFVERANVMVVATHSPNILRKWCNRAILLEHGRLLLDGQVEEALDAYRERVSTYAR